MLEIPLKLQFFDYCEKALNHAAFQQRILPTLVYVASSSSSALASFRAAVSKPSVNQL
jgi:hypothetical protein